MMVAAFVSEIISNWICFSFAVANDYLTFVGILTGQSMGHGAQWGPWAAQVAVILDSGVCLHDSRYGIADSDRCTHP